MNGPDKIIIGIHGVGDQTDGTTIQAIHRRFARHHNVPPALTLGNLRSARDMAGVYCWKVPGNGLTLGFAEVYWADIARSCANEGYVLEETRSWAKALVERLATCLAGQGFTLADRKLAVRVLREMIESISVLKRLFFLTDKAGIFSFDLERILNHYVNDVQVVTEYEKQRKAIIGRFNMLMEKLQQHYPEAEIHVIAHSEGTVVSLLALLEALTQDPAEVPWVRRVKSFVTLGSPIDKHFFLWPELWEAFAGPYAQLPEPQRIDWKNYYDQGDPIGFKLDVFRAELASRNYPFSNGPDDELGFSRYPLPGKAHVDYWEDDGLFAHIIEQVVGAGRGTGAPKPADNLLAQAVGYVVPYLIALLSLFGGLYLLYAAVLKFMDQPATAVEVVGDVSLLTLLMAGMTIAARIPRLTRKLSVHAVGAAIFIGASVCFIIFFDRDVARSLFGFAGSYVDGVENEALVGLAGGISLLSAVIGVRWSSMSAASLLLPGGAVVLALVALLMHQELTGISVSCCQCLSQHGPLKPIILAVSIFLYLWWLSTLIFDLTFVWHRYIRHDQGMEVLKKCRRETAV